ncbi:hypothetical protein ACI3PL_26105, partial [Lacticaseibacillus paracasei]
DDDDEEGDDDEEASDDSTDGVDAADEDEDADEDEEEDEEEKALATLGKKKGVYSTAALYKLCCAVTGKKSVSAVFGALDAQRERL